MMDSRLAPSGMPQATTPTSGHDAALRLRARKTSDEFESMFLSNMLQSMFSGIEAEPPFGGGDTEKTYRELLVGEYAKEMQSHGGIGISDQVYREILLLQEGARP